MNLKKIIDSLNNEKIVLSSKDKEAIQNMIQDTFEMTPEHGYAYIDLHGHMFASHFSDDDTGTFFELVANPEWEDFDGETIDIDFDTGTQLIFSDKGKATVFGGDGPKVPSLSKICKSIEGFINNPTEPREKSVLPKWAVFAHMFTPDLEEIAVNTLESRGYKNVTAKFSQDNDWDNLGKNRSIDVDVPEVARVRFLFGENSAWVSESPLETWGTYMMRGDTVEEVFINMYEDIIAGHHKLTKAMERAEKARERRNR